jgi:hypothetical protein
MLVAFVILAAATQAEVRASAAPFDFSRSYVVAISTDEGRCTFFMTDAGEDARQLTDTLRRNYDASLGIEILTDGRTPARCVTKAQRAVTKAGFRHYRVRPATDLDRSPGIP